MSTTENIASQVQTTYEQYMKIKTLVDVGFFLVDYVVMGGEVTKDIKHNDQINVSEIVASLDFDVIHHEAVSFKTKITNTTYFLDYCSDGRYFFDTAHYSGSYLPIAEVTTDSYGNVSVITDKRVNVGGFRLRSGYEYPEIAALQAEFAEQVGPIFNVKGYGAKGDGVTDDSTSVKSARDAAYASGGGTIYFPAGKYLISSKIVIDINDPAWLGTGLNMRGDGAGSTTILCGVFGDHAFHVQGEHGSCFHMQDLTLKGVDLQLSRGLHMSNLSEQYIENLFFSNLFLGIEMEDCVRTKFVSCTFNQNLNGMYANNQVKEIGSTPNAIDLFGCVFYGNAQSAAYFYGGCNINFFGGTVEISGHADAGANRWGVKIENGGKYGGAIANFYGTYFEGNANIADIWISHGDYAGTYSVNGCTFNKFVSPNHAPNNILLIAGGSAAANLVVSNCSFQNRGIAANADEKYISILSGGAPVFFEEMGNNYQYKEERPVSPTNRVFASGRFVGLSSAPSVYRGFNVADIIRNGTGDYTINFVLPSVSPAKIMSGGIDVIGFVQLIPLNETSIRVKVFAPNGTTPLDPTELNIICME